jgi:hypothetical protein
MQYFANLLSMTTRMRQAPTLCRNNIVINCIGKSLTVTQLQLLHFLWRACTLQVPALAHLALRKPTTNPWATILEFYQTYFSKRTV